MKGLATRHVHALGFKTQKIDKRDSKIILDVKEKDWRNLLILAYYSMSLMPAFLLEGCMASIIKSRMMSGEFTISKPLELLPLFNLLGKYENLFKNEHMYEYEGSQEIFMQRINYFVD